MPRKAEWGFEKRLDVNRKNAYEVISNNYYRPQAKVMFSQASVSHSVLNWPSFCSQLASWLLGHCSSLLRRGWYAPYWNAFLLDVIFTKRILEELFANNSSVIHLININNCYKTDLRKIINCSDVHVINIFIAKLF